MHTNGCFLKWTLTVTFCKEKRDDENYNDVFTSDDETLFKDTDIYAKRGNWPRYFSNIFSDQRFNGTQQRAAEAKQRAAASARRLPNLL